MSSVSLHAQPVNYRAGRKYTLTFLPSEPGFIVRRDDGQEALIPKALFLKLARGSGLRAQILQAMRQPRRPVRFEAGSPEECAENYQRSLVPAGSEDARSLRNPIR
jgi:hypothetical protein